MLVRTRLFEVAIERSLRSSTVVSYETLLGRIGVLDQETSEVTREGVMEALWRIESPNTRRSIIIALRAVLGLHLPIPRSIPKRYDLPDEDTLRLALMMSPHEIRGLLMMYAGLRVGEACAITAKDVSGNRLRVDKQVQQVFRTGHRTTAKIAPVKAGEGSVVIPEWLVPMVMTLTQTEKPDAVRESLRRAGVKVGIRLNPHLLRHWMATTLLDRGVPLIVVSRQLRHSDVATTLRTYAQGDDGLEVQRAFG